MLLLVLVLYHHLLYMTADMVCWSAPAAVMCSVFCATSPSAVFAVY